MSGLREPTQCERVLRYARRPEGVTQVDFDAPTIDGWKPIKRVAARIDDLEKKRGAVFRSLGWRNKCKIYKLVSIDVEKDGGAGNGSFPLCGVDIHNPSPVATVPLSADDQLFSLPPANAIYGEEAA